MYFGSYLFVSEQFKSNIKIIAELSWIATWSRGLKVLLPIRKKIERRHGLCTLQLHCKELQNDTGNRI